MSTPCISLKQAAKHFMQIAQFMEVLGENKFKVQSFASAARTLDQYSGSMREALEAAKAKQLRGFGAQLTQDLEMLYTHGDTEVHAELLSQLGEPFVEVLSLPGIGPKKAKLLREEIGITSLEELLTACENGTLSRIRGFGKKSVEGIATAIHIRKAQRGHLRLNQAFALRDEVVALLAKETESIKAVGQLARGAEVITSLDFLYCNSSPENIGKAIESHYPGAKSKTETLAGVFAECCTSLLHIQLTNHCQLRFYQADSQHYSAAVFLTGCSTEHLNKITSAFEQQGDSLSTLVADAPDASAAVYAALDMQVVPPALREEAELSELKAREMTTLIEREDISGIIHAHSQYSDGTASLEQMARRVKEQGYGYLGISDHSKSASYAGGLSEDDIARQHEEIERLNELLAPFVILKGIESDILADGSLDYSEKILERFDFVIASIHSGLKMTADEMTSRVKKGIENPFTRVLGHLSTRKLLQRQPAEMHVEAILEHAAQHNVALEINANPYRLDLSYHYHQKAASLGILLPICPDAHSLEGIHDVDYGVLMARKGGLSAAQIPTAWPLAKALEFWSAGRYGSKK